MKLVKKQTLKVAKKHVDVATKELTKALKLLLKDHKHGEAQDGYFFNVRVLESIDSLDDLKAHLIKSERVSK